MIVYTRSYKTMKYEKLISGGDVCQFSNLLTAKYWENVGFFRSIAFQNMRNIIDEVT